MESNIQRLRGLYTDIRNAAYESNSKGVTAQKVKTGKSICNAELSNMNENGDFANLEEVQFYKQKFTNIGKLMKQANQTKFTKSKYFSELQNILKQEKFVLPNSYIKNEPQNSSMSQPPPVQNLAISAFFESKKSKISPDTAFRSILQDMPVTNKSFRKKSTKKIQTSQTNIMEKVENGNGIKEEEFMRVVQENEKLKKKLQEQKRRLAKVQDTEDEFQRLTFRIKSLEDENEKLLSENSKLRSEKTVTVYTNYYPPTQTTSHEEVFQPYTFQTRENDLYKLSVRNEGESSQHANYFEERNHVYPIQETMSEHERHSTFSSLSMSRSYYSERGSHQLSHLGIDDKRVISKNKVAFFKSSFLICKDNDIEIGYKRSELEGNYDKMKLIFYVNNKTGKQKSVSIVYYFEKEYYDIDVREKMESVLSYGQARQVSSITLQSITDINSVIEAVLTIDGKEYRVWVPALFINFEYPKNLDDWSGTVKKTVVVNKYFASASHVEKLLGNKMRSTYDEGQLWGCSKLHSGPIRLRWKSNNKVEIQTSPIWMDVITFILFDYQP